jgi:hypothetical protein
MVRRTWSFVLVACVLTSAVACRGASRDTRLPSRSVGPRDFGIRHYPDEPSGSGLCGSYSVLWEPSNAKRHTRSTLTALDGGKVGIDLKGHLQEQLRALWCDDLDDDGRYELATLRSSSRDARCCHLARVDTLAGKKRLEADLGYVDQLEPKQLDGEGAEELVSRSDVLAGLGGLSEKASVGAFLPLVFALSDGHYVEATKRFPDHIRKSLARATKDLDGAIGNEPTDVVEALALGVFGHRVLLGDEDDGFDDVVKVVPDVVARWLRTHRDAAAALIRDGERRGR